MNSSSHASSSHPHAQKAPPVDSQAVLQSLERGAALLRTNVRREPYASLGLALGLGLVVGGGMWRVLARSLVGAGARFAVAVVIPALLDNNQRNQNQES